MRSLWRTVTHYKTTKGFNRLFSTNKTYIKAQKFGDNKFLNLFQQQVTKQGDASVLIFDEQHITYSQFYESCLQCALSLNEEYGIKHGDVVGVMSHAIPCLAYVAIACQMLNAVFFPINPNLPSEVLHHQIKSTNCQLIVTDDNSINTSNIPCKNILYKDEQIFWSETKYGDTSFMENILTDLINEENYNENDPSVMICTSGSTAIPKIVVHCNKSMHFSLDHPFGSLLGKNKSLLNSQPYHASYYGSLMLSTACGGCSVYPSKIMRDKECSNSQKVLDMIRLAELHRIGMVGAIVTPVYELVRMNRAFPDCVKTIFSGGDIIPTRLMAKFMKVHSKRSEVRIVNGYGATECGALGFTSPLLCTEENANDIDKIENYLMCLTKDKTVQHRVDEETNELLVKTNSMMIGYHNEAEKTKQCFTEDGYYRTGDTIHVIEDTKDCFRFTVIARNKYVIVTENGYVFPYYIENVLLSHKNVTGATVVGISSNIVLEHSVEENSEYKYPVGFVTVNVEMNEDEEKQLVNELLDLCKNQRSSKEVPYIIFVLDEIPKLMVGKISKHKLIEIATNHFQNAV